MDTVSVKMVSEENDKNKVGVSRKIEIIPWKVCTNNFSSRVGMRQKKWMSEHSEQVLQMLHVSL